MQYVNRHAIRDEKGTQLEQAIGVVKSLRQCYSEGRYPRTSTWTSEQSQRPLVNITWTDYKE